LEDSYQFSITRKLWIFGFGVESFRDLQICPQLDKKRVTEIPNNDHPLGRHF
jgi:hypothetical protein